MRLVLNCPILTAYGVFEFRKVTVEEARKFVQTDFVSGIGHETAARFLTDVLGVPVQMNRVTTKMAPGDEALVLRIVNRLPEGKVSLTLDEQNAMFAEGGIEFGVMRLRKE